MGTTVLNVGSSDRVLSVAQAAYVAGFVDGEGCLTITRARRVGSRAGFTYQATFTIGNTNLDALKRIQAMCGNGRILLSDKRTKLGHKVMYRLDFTANQIRHLLPQLRPHLFVKQRQAEVLAEFLGRRLSGRNTTADEWQWMEQQRSVIRTLNLRGIKNTEPDVLSVRDVAEHPAAARQCSVDGCGGRHYGHGLCFGHYYEQIARPSRLAQKEAVKRGRDGRICVMCQQPFTPVRADSECCSRKCRDRRYYKQNSDRLKAQVAAYKARKRKELMPA